MPLQRNEYVLGIDLGLTNTCAAIMTSRTPDPIAISYRDGRRLLKSCVKYSKPFDVGFNAYKHLIYGLPGAVKNSKRIIGRYYKDEIVQRCIKENQCGVEIKEVNGKPVFLIDDTTLISPSDVSSEIIKRVVVKAEEYVKKAYGDGMKCTKIAVTFPAHFDNNQRTATLLAVEKAGICKEKLTMLNEPSAAAFYYCKSNKIDNQTILVYDWGSETFDVSIVRVIGNEYKVLKSAGNPFLGGADIDTLFAKVIEKKYEESYHEPLIDTKDEKIRRRYYLRLNAIAENAKIQLSNFETVEVYLSVFGIQNKNDSDSDSDSDSGSDFDFEDDDDEIYVEVTRDDLDKCIRELIDQTIEIVRNCIQDCRMTVSHIDRVVMIGGSSRLLMVRNRLRYLFGDEKLSGAVHPDEAVACGACQSLVEKLQIESCSICPLSEELAGSQLEYLIRRHTHIEYKCKKVKPYLDYCSVLQNCLGCFIYQGGENYSSANGKQGTYSMIGKYKSEENGYSRSSEVSFVTIYTIDEWGIIHIIEKCKDNNHVMVDSCIRWEEPV